jgi:serine/threonine protein kinase
VWRGVWRSVAGEREVAVKVSLAKVGDDADRLRVEEVGLMHELRAHPNVVQLLGFCTQPAAIVMEFLKVVQDKATLRDWIRGDDYVGASTSTLVDIAYQICAGMAYVHSVGVLHRDMKPSNVLMMRRRSEDGGGWIVKVADFGVSARLQVVSGREGPVNISHHAVGTRGYQAPEQVFPETCYGGSERHPSHEDRDSNREFVLTTKADVWSFGIVLFRLFCGGDNSSSSVVVVESAWDNILRKSRNSLRGVKYSVSVHGLSLPVAARMRNSLLSCSRKRRVVERWTRWRSRWRSGVCGRWRRSARRSSS